jgi:sulfonate transport system substrate-binding protein
LFAEASGVDIAAQRRSVDRAEFTFGPVTDKVVAEQQAVADRFQRLGLIPIPIAVRDIVWDGKSSS